MFYRKNLVRLMATGMALTGGMAAGAGCKPEQIEIHAGRQEAAAELAGTAREAMSAARGGGATLNVPAEQAGQIVATIGEQTITVGDVAARIGALPIHMQATYTTAERRRALVEEMINFELLAAEAKRLKLDETPAVQRALKVALAKAVMAKEFGDEAALGPITDAELKAYYEAHRDQFVVPESRKAALLVKHTEDEAKDILVPLSAALDANPERRRPVFGDYAAKESLDGNTASKRGAMGQIFATGLGDAGQRLAVELSAKVVFGIEKVGEVAGPVEIGPHRWALIQLTHIEPASGRNFEEMRLGVRRAIVASRREARRAEYLKALVAKSAVEIDEEALAGLTKAANATDAVPASALIANPAPKTAPTNDTPKAVKALPKINPNLKLGLRAPGARDLLNMKPIETSKKRPAPSLTEEEVRDKMGGRPEEGR